MDKKFIVILVLVAITSLLIGTMFNGSGDQQVSYQHKYDSLKRVVTQNRATLKQTTIARDSARTALSQLKYQVIQLNNTIVIRDNMYQKERAHYRDMLKALSPSGLAKEARKAYINAHPAPLFDTTDLGEPVAVEREPVIHLLEQDKRAEHLAKENADLKELDTIRGKEVVNLLNQVNAYQTDSAAYEGIIHAQDEELTTRKQELVDTKRAHRKELRRERVQKVVATVIAVGSIIVSIIL